MGAGAAAAANWAGSPASGDRSSSHESQPTAAKYSRYRSLRERSVSSTASAGSRSLLGNTTSISSINSNNNDKDDQQQHHRSVGSGQQQQRHSTTSGNPISRSMSMSRYRRRTNNVSVSGDATQTVQKFNGDPPRPACVDNPPRGALPPVPTIPRALRRTSSGSSGRSSKNPSVPSSSRSSSTIRTTEQKEEGHHADATKVSLDLPSPPSPSPPPPPPSAVTTALTAPPRRRPLRHTSDANSRGHDIAPLRSRMEMTTMENHQQSQSQSQSQSRPSTAGGDGNQQRQRKMIDLTERRSKLREEQEGTAKGNDEAAARREAETNPILAEQKKKDLERLQMQLANSHQATVQAHKAKSPVIEKFAFLSKVRKHKNDLSPGLSPGLSPTTPSSATASISEFSQRTATMESTRTIPTGIEAGGRGIVPQTDAPASAINSGDRVSALMNIRHCVSRWFSDTFVLMHW